MIHYDTLKCAIMVLGNSNLKYNQKRRFSFVLECFFSLKKEGEHYG